MKPNHLCWALATILLILAIWSQQAKAETAIHLGGWSTHLITDDATNESHDMVMIEHGRWMAGRFNNSFDRESYAIGYGWSRQWGHWRGSVHVGAVKGYRTCYGDDDSNGDICPLAVPMVSYTRYRVQPEMMLMGDAVVAAVRLMLY